MRAWLAKRRVYQLILNGCLWVAVLASLSTRALPEIEWLAGCIVLLCGIVALTVYFVNPEIDDAQKHPVHQQLALSDRRSEQPLPEQPNSPTLWTIDVGAGTWAATQFVLPESENYTLLTPLPRMKAVRTKTPQSERLRKSFEAFRTELNEERFTTTIGLVTFVVVGHQIRVHVAPPNKVAPTIGSSSTSVGEAQYDEPIVGRVYH